jgi:NAD(P)H-hydrate epimerase
MREVDRLMVEEFGITLFQMMENTGRALARLARWLFLDGDARSKHVVVLTGGGGNGGGGLVCARNLHNWGAEVEVFSTLPREDLGEVPLHQLAILDTLGVSYTTVTGVIDLPEHADLIVDAMIGYSLSGAPRGPIASLIRSANGQGAPILALDVPSGFDATAGSVLEPAIQAAATLTLAMPKQGLLEPNVGTWVGELYLADIGVPPELYRRLDPPVRVDAIFSEEDIRKLS